MTKVELFESVYNESSIDTANFLRGINKVSTHSSFHAGDVVHVDLGKSLHSDYVPAIVISQVGPKTLKVAISKEDCNKFLGMSPSNDIVKCVDLQNVKEYVFQR